MTDGRGKTYMQTLWPDHAIQGTSGTEIEAGLKSKLEPWQAKMKICRKVSPDSLSLSMHTSELNDLCRLGTPMSRAIRLSKVMLRMLRAQRTRRRKTRANAHRAIPRWPSFCGTTRLTGSSSSVLRRITGMPGIHLAYVQVR